MIEFFPSATIFYMLYCWTQLNILYCYISPLMLYYIILLTFFSISQLSLYCVLLLNTISLSICIVYHYWHCTVCYYWYHVNSKGDDLIIPINVWLIFVLMIAFVIVKQMRRLIASKFYHIISLPNCNYFT